jgi:anti-sigma factor RsiW
VTNNRPIDGEDNELTQAERIRRLIRRCDTEAERVAELEDQISSLRAGLAVALDQRDEARRLVCESQAQKEQGTPEGWAQEWGWDCYKDQPNG